MWTKVNKQVVNIVNDILSVGLGNIKNIDYGMNTEQCNRCIRHNINPLFILHVRSVRLERKERKIMTATVADGFYFLRKETQRKIKEKKERVPRVMGYIDRIKTDIAEIEGEIRHQKDLLKEAKADLKAQQQYLKDIQS